MVSYMDLTTHLSGIDMARIVKLKFLTLVTFLLLIVTFSDEVYSNNAQDDAFLGKEKIQSNKEIKYGSERFKSKKQQDNNNKIYEKVFETQIEKSEFYECYDNRQMFSRFKADICADINHKYSNECKGSRKGERCVLNKIYFESFLNLKCQEKSYNEFTNYFLRTPKLNNELITLTYGCKGSNIKKVTNSHKPEKEIEITSKNYKKFLKCQDLEMSMMVNDYEKMVNRYKENRQNTPDNMPDFGKKYYSNLAEYKKNPFKICPLDKVFVESYLIKICKKNNFSSYDSYYFRASNVANINPKIIYKCSSDFTKVKSPKYKEVEHYDESSPLKSTSSLDYAKKECLELGFKNNTEKFGECVLQLSK